MKADGIWRTTIVVPFIFVLLFVHLPLNVNAKATTDSGWKEIATGSVHNLGIKQDGTVWTWGSGIPELYGMRGERDEIPQVVPVKVKKLNDVIQVAAGGSHSLALKKDGSVWAWGGNGEGEIGDGTRSKYDGYTRTYIINENRPDPIQVKGLTNVVQIAAGHSGSYAIREDGTMWAWGSLLGPVAAELPGYTGIQSISVGYGHNLILKKDGTVWQEASSLLTLADGQVQNLGTTSLAQIEGLQHIVKIAAGSGTSHALKDDGTVWAWGYNNSGEVGDGTTIDRSEPVQIIGIDDVIDIAASAGGPFYLRRDGTLWSNGTNTGGQLGYGTYEGSLVPKQVIGLKKIKKIASSGIGYRAMAIRQDQTLWSWGNGYVGDGTEWWRTSPVWLKSFDNEVLTHNLITVLIDGTVIDFDQPPVVINGRTMVPLRMIFDALGAVIEWDQSTQTVTATRGSMIVKLTIGASIAYVNGEERILDSPGIIVNERTLVPARFIGESLDAEVGWNEETLTVTIDSKATIEVTIDQITTDPYYFEQVGSKVKGQVVGVGQVGIPGVNVRFHNDSNSTTSSLASDSRGYYSTDGLVEGEVYYVSIFVDDMKKGSIIAHNNINYCVPRSKEFTYLNNELPMIKLQEVQLMGKLVNVDNKPVADMTVLVIDSNNSTNNAFSTVTDEAGSFPLCGLTSGEKYKMSLIQFFLASTDIHERKGITSGPYEFTYDSAMNNLPDYMVIYEK